MFVSGGPNGDPPGVQRLIIYLLAPLLYWLLSSREDIFAMQGSRTACITQSLTHTSGCPVNPFLHRMYVSPWVATPLILPSRPSLSEAWPTIPLQFVPASVYVPLGAPSLWSCGRSLARCLFHECSRSDFIVMHHPPLPFIRRMACAPSVEDFRMMSAQISTAQWKSVMFSGYLTTRPNLHVFVFFSHVYFPAFGQAVVTGVVPSPPRFLR